MYQQANDSTCQPCHPGCLRCTGPTNNTCQACRNVTDPNNASLSTNYYLTIGNSICSTICPTGQFIRAGFPNECQLCSIQCIACSITSINCTEFFMCSVGFFFFRATNSCLTVCPNGFYADAFTGYCEPCNGGCTLCNGPTLQNCSACQTNASGVHFYK